MMTKVLIHAVEKIRAKGIKIKRGYLLHSRCMALDEALDMKASRIDNAGFFFGMFGTCCAFFGITWVLVVNWPLEL